MRSIRREEVPVVIEDNGVEVRLRDEDGLSVGFVRLPAGADLRPATKGLQDDLCPCPHWGYMIKGRVRMHTRDGHTDPPTLEIEMLSPRLTVGAAEPSVPTKSQRPITPPARTSPAAREESAPPRRSSCSPRIGSPGPGGVLG